QFYLLDEPGKALIHGRTHLRSSIQQDLHGQGAFLDTGWGIWRSPPAAIGVLRFDQPGDSTPSAIVIYHIKVAISGQNSSRPVSGVFLFRRILVAEPKGQPRTIGSLAHSKKFKSVSQIPLEERQRETGE